MKCTRLILSLTELVLAGLLLPQTSKAAISTNDGPMEPFSLSVYDTGVGVGIDSMGYVETFLRNGILYQNSQSITGPQATGYFTAPGWAPLVNTFMSPYMASDPVVAKDQNSMLDVFFIGPDGNPWHQYQTGYDNQNDSTWSLLPDPLVPGALPSVGATPFSNVAVVLVNNILHVYYLGADGALWEITQATANDEDEWNAPVSLGNGGIASGHPSAVVSGGVTMVFYRSDETDPTTGNRGFIYYSANDAAPVKIPGPVISGNITPIINGDGRIELFYRGSEDGLWHVWQTAPGANASWSTPQQLSETGGTLTSDPIASFNANGSIQVFYRSTEGDIWTVVRNTDNQGAGEWSCRVDLMNSEANYVNIPASPISVSPNQKNNNGALQLFFVGGINTTLGGNVSRTAIDRGNLTATPGSIAATSFNDIWTLMQTSANNNPSCPQNGKSGWTLPATMGGLMQQTMPPTDPVNADR